MGDGLHRKVGGLEEVLGLAESLSGKPSTGSGSELLSETPPEGSFAHTHPSREIGEGLVVVEVCGEVLQDHCERITAIGTSTCEDGIGQDLRQDALALTGGDESASDGRGSSGAVVGAHKVQVDVQAGACPGAGDDVTVVEVEDAWFLDQVRVRRAEGLGMAPVRRGATPSEHVGGCGEGHPGTGRHDASTAGMSIMDGGNDFGIVLHPDWATPGEHHRVRRAKSVQTCGDADVVSFSATHTARVESAHHYLVATFARTRCFAGDAEDVLDLSQLRQTDPVADQDDHAVRPAVVGQRRHGERHGRIVSTGGR